MASPQCVTAWVRIPCADCNRHLVAVSVLITTKTKQGNKKSVCERKRNCGLCGGPVVQGRHHECGKRFCGTCKANREIGHLCYMQPLKNVLPSGDGTLHILRFGKDSEYQVLRDSPGALSESGLLTAVLFEMRQSGRYPTRLRAVLQFWEDDSVDLLSYHCE